MSGIDQSGSTGSTLEAEKGRPINGAGPTRPDPAGKVSHTGLVQAIMEDGRVLLESKWGKMGRYLHTPEQHAYPTHQPTYYRSHRAGHQLRPAKYAPKPVADQ